MDSYQSPVGNCPDSASVLNINSLEMPFNNTLIVISCQVITDDSIVNWAILMTIRGRWFCSIRVPKNCQFSDQILIVMAISMG